MSRNIQVPYAQSILKGVRGLNIIGRRLLYGLNIIPILI